MSLAFGSIWRSRLRNAAVPELLNHATRRSQAPIRAFPPAPPSITSSRSYKPYPRRAPRHHPKTKNRYEEVERSTRSRLELRNKILEEISTTQAEPSEGFQTGSNHARNTFIRQAFKAKGPAIGEATLDMMKSPYVPKALTYPSPTATAASLRHARRVARAQVGFDILAYREHDVVPRWDKILARLKDLSVKTNKPDMAAMRVLLPKSWGLALTPETVQYIESTTGLLTKLRVTPDHQQSRSVILRGKKSVLARAADELVAAAPEIEVFQLGNVATIAYEEKQLWPVIDGALDDGALLPPDRPDSLWAHQEFESYWINTPYENTPKPKKWTEETFPAYIARLVCGRLRSDLVMPLYAKSTPNGSMGVDADGIRVKLIMAAFEDPEARSCITLPILKMAMNFLSTRGGHRASATQLFHLADRYGVPMDTDVFNIMLQGYVIRRDAWHFHNILRMMKNRFFQANSWTWLLFLKLVANSDTQKQIIVAIFEAGLLTDLAMRREAAVVMTQHNAYTAFTAGQSLEAFLKEQARMYGEDWITSESQHTLVQELLRFYKPDNKRFEEVQQVFSLRPTDGRPIKLETINEVLEWSVANKNWRSALWALKEATERGIEIDHRTYDNVIKLALMGRSPHALSVAFFYAIVEHKLQGSTRLLMRDVLLQKFKHGFWTNRSIVIGTKEMTRRLRHSRKEIRNKGELIRVIETLTLEECDGKQDKPDKPLWYMLDVALRTMDGPLHSRLSRGKEDPPSDKNKLVIKVTGPSGHKNLRLAGVFMPEQVIRGWKPGQQDVFKDGDAQRLFKERDALSDYDEAGSDASVDFDVADYAEEADLVLAIAEEEPNNVTSVTGGHAAQEQPPPETAPATSEEDSVSKNESTPAAEQQPDNTLPETDSHATQKQPSEKLSPLRWTNLPGPEEQPTDQSTTAQATPGNVDNTKP